jgi:ABC-type phosphate transport system permease subunit
MGSFTFQPKHFWNNFRQLVNIFVTTLNSVPKVLDGFFQLVFWLQILLEDFKPPASLR